MGPDRTPVQIYDCNGTPAQNWVWNEANTKIRLADSNFCLDAGTNPASGVGMKIWTSVLLSHLISSNPI